MKSLTRQYSPLFSSAARISSGRSALSGFLVAASRWRLLALSHSAVKSRTEKTAPATQLAKFSCPLATSPLRSTTSKISAMTVSTMLLFSVSDPQLSTSITSLGSNDSARFKSFLSAGRQASNNDFVLLVWSFRMRNWNQLTNQSLYVVPVEVRNIGQESSIFVAGEYWWYIEVKSGDNFSWVGSDNCLQTLQENDSWFLSFKLI